MFRIAKLTDYGLVLLSHMARHEGREHTARELSAETRLPLPTVGKLLKAMVHGGLLLSHRGTKGGYRMVKPAADVTLAEIIVALEGPIAITECNVETSSLCEHETGCQVRPHWQVINRALRESLSGVTLRELAVPPAPQAPKRLVSPLSLPGRARALPSHPPGGANP